MSAEEEIIKRYYSISEVAADLNVNASLIRFWEKEFTQINPKKNRKGNRLFTLGDLENLRAIYHLVKEKGFTLEGARNSLKENKSEISKNTKISNTLKRIRTDLEKLKESV